MLRNLKKIILFRSPLLNDHDRFNCHAFSSKYFIVSAYNASHTCTSLFKIVVVSKRPFILIRTERLLSFTF